MAWHPFRNLGLKATALALGTLLWLTVSGHQVERRVRVPVSYSNVPAALEMTNEQDDVSVLVRGTDTEVGGFGPGDIRVIVDLSDATAGTNMVPLGPESVEAPLGVDVLRLEPGTVTVVLERSAHKEVPVDPLLVGQPAEGFKVGAVSVSPAAVSVTGPESRLASPMSIVTDRIRMEGRRAGFEAVVGVVSVDAQVRLVGPRTVTVSVDIVPERAGE